MGCSKACSHQEMIRTSYPDRICYRPGVMFTSAVCFSLRESGQGSAPHVLLGNPDGVDLDSHAHSVSSGRRVPTLCTCRRSPLRRSSFHPGKEFYPADFPPSPDISHSEFCPLTFHIRNSVRRHFTSSGYLTAGWERRKFQLPRSDISRSSNSAYPESIRGRQFRLPGAILHSAAVFS